MKLKTRCSCQPNDELDIPIAVTYIALNSSGLVGAPKRWHLALPHVLLVGRLLVVLSQQVELAGRQVRLRYFRCYLVHAPLLGTIACPFTGQEALHACRLRGLPFGLEPFVFSLQLFKLVRVLGDLFLQGLHLLGAVLLFKLPTDRNDGLTTWLSIFRARSIRCAFGSPQVWVSTPARASWSSCFPSTDPAASGTRLIAVLSPHGDGQVRFGDASLNYLSQSFFSGRLVTHFGVDV